MRSTMEHRPRRGLRRAPPHPDHSSAPSTATATSRGYGVDPWIQAGASPRFDGNTGPHHHVRCVGCGLVNDLAVPLDTRREQAAARAMDFQVLGHHVEVQGLCPACRPGPADRSLPSDDARH